MAWVRGEFAHVSGRFVRREMTRADAKGRFALEAGGPDWKPTGIVAWSLDAAAAVAFDKPPAEAGSADDPWVFALAPEPVVAGRVEDREGRPVPGVYVQALIRRPEDPPERRRSIDTWSDWRGRAKAWAITSGTPARPRSVTN